MILARIRARNDHAHRFLVEAFETAPPLQVFEVTSERPFAQEFFGLFGRDQLRGEQFLHPCV